MVDDNAERAGVVLEIVDRAGSLHARGVDERAIRAGDGDSELTFEGCQQRAARQGTLHSEYGVARELRITCEFSLRKRAARCERNAGAAGDACIRDLQPARRAIDERIGIAALQVLRLDEDVSAVEPVCLLLAKDGVQQLGRRGLREVDSRIAGDHPGFVVLVDLQVHVGAGILHVEGAVVNDEAKLAAIEGGVDADIVVGTVAVEAGYVIFCATKRAGWITGSEEGVKGPSGEVVIRAVVVDARVVCGNGRAVADGDGRTRSLQAELSGNLPVFVALCGGIDVLVGAGVLQAPHVDDDADVLRGRCNADVEVGAEVVDAGDLHRAAVELALVFGGVAKGVDRPAGIAVVPIEVMNADVLGWDRRIRRARAPTAKAMTEERTMTRRTE